MAVYPPQSPATFPTSENLFEAAKADKCSVIVCVPTFVEVLRVTIAAYQSSNAYVHSNGR